jgi:DNA polymerase-4
MVRVRFADLRSITRSITLPAPVSSTPILAGVIAELVAAALAGYPEERELSLLGLSVSHLASETGLQLELPLDLGDGELMWPGTRPGRPDGHWTGR